MLLLMTDSFDHYMKQSGQEGLGLGRGLLDEGD